MIGIERVQEVVDEVAQSLDLSPLKFGEDCCSETQINGFPITLMYSSNPIEFLWMIVDLGQVQDDPDILRGLLQLGFVTWASGQMTIGLDRDGEHLVGYSAAPVDQLTPDVVRAQLERLTAGAETICDRLAHQDFTLAPVTEPASFEKARLDWQV